MTFWKNKKADEITKSLFLNKVIKILIYKKCASIIVNSINCEIQKKLESLGK